VRARFVTQAEYDCAAFITYEDGTRFIGVGMTAAYASLSGGYDLTIPELTGALNFQLGWALQPGGDLFWSASRLGGTLGLGADACRATA